MIHHPTRRCFVLKEKIQTLVDASILTLKSEQKKVITNMMTLNFENFSKMTVQDGLIPILKERLEVINPLAEKQEVKGLVPLTTKSREIVWMYQILSMTSNGNKCRPKLKGKTCNVISLAQNDDAVAVSSLSDSKEEKFTFMTRPATSQLVGTRSGKQYLWQYDQTSDEIKQPTTSGNATPVQASAPTLPLDKEKQKEV